jgi:GntR family transcriptional regulator
VDEQLVEKRRGLGMYVRENVRDLLLEAERRKFLEKDWPPIRQTIERLGLSAQELLAPPKTNGSGSKEGKG